MKLATKEGSKVMTVIASPGQGPDRSIEISYTDTKVWDSNPRPLPATISLLLPSSHYANRLVLFNYVDLVQTDCFSIRGNLCNLQPTKSSKP